MTAPSVISNPMMARKSDKKSILRFYKKYNYSARFIGFDTCYVIKENHNIVASVIISQGPKPSDHLKAFANPASNTRLKSQQENLDKLEHVIPLNAALPEPEIKRQYLLHALFIAPHHRHQGYAQTLLKHVLSRYQNLVCFAHLSLSSLYLNNGFSLIENDFLQNSLSPDLLNRLLQYAKKKSELSAFTTCKIITDMINESHS